MNDSKFADGDTSVDVNGEAPQGIDRNHFEMIVQEYRSEIEKLSEAIQNERKERNQTEKDAIDLLKRVKDKYDHRLTSNKQSFEHQLCSVKETLSNENAKIIQERQLLVAEIHELRSRCDQLTSKLHVCSCDKDLLANEVKSLKSNIDTLQQERREWEREQKQSGLALELELKQKNSALLEKISVLRETVKHQETALKASLQNDTISQKTREFLSKNNIIGLEKWKCYEECKKENNILASKLKELETLKVSVIRIMDEKQKGESQLKAVEYELKQVKKDLICVTEELEKEKNEAGELSKRLEESETSNNNLKSEVVVLKQTLENKEESLLKFKETCVNLDSQAQYLETSLGVLQQQKENAVKEKQEITLYAQMMKENLEGLMKELSEERSKNSEILNQLQNFRECYRNEIENKEKELKRIEDELSVELRMKDDYRQQTDSLQQEILLKNSTTEQLISRIDELENELLSIKEEAATHITMIRNLKLENVRLCHALEESLTKYEKSQSRINDIVNELDEKEAEFDREKLKLQETVNQQLKLIDFLQTKNEKQKKPWIAINSPKSYSSQTVTSTNLKEIEAELEKEQRKNEYLIYEMERTKAELSSCTSKIKKYEQNLDEEINQAIADDIKINNDKKREILELSAQYVNTKVLSSSPSAPPYYTVHCDDCKSTSTTSSLTTDNNDADSPKVYNVQLHENRNEFTFTDSMLAELSE